MQHDNRDKAIAKREVQFMVAMNSKLKVETLEKKLGILTTLLNKEGISSERKSKLIQDLQNTEGFLLDALCSKLPPF